METVQLKTNIKCGGCVATVTPYLNQAVGEGNWQGDIQNPDKVLTVSTNDAALVEEAVEKAGYTAGQL